MVQVRGSAGSFFPSRTMMNVNITYNQIDETLEALLIDGYNNFPLPVQVEGVVSSADAVYYNQ
jgi:hypothetical protein